MDINETKGVLKIEDRCTCWENSSSQLYIYKYELLIKQDAQVELKGHLFCGSFKILDIISDNEIIVSVDGLKEQSLKRGETKVFENSDSCGEGNHFEAFRSELTVTFVDE